MVFGGVMVLMAFMGFVGFMGLAVCLWASAFSGLA